MLGQEQADIRNQYKQSQIRDNQGALIAVTPLPALGAIDVIDASRILSRRDATIYDVVTGKKLNATQLPPDKSVVAGAFVLSRIGRNLVTMHY